MGVCLPLLSLPATTTATGGCEGGNSGARRERAAGLRHGGQGATTWRPRRDTRWRPRRDVTRRPRRDATWWHPTPGALGRCVQEQGAAGAGGEESEGPHPACRSSLRRAGLSPGRRRTRCSWSRSCRRRGRPARGRRRRCRWRSRRPCGSRPRRGGRRLARGS